MNKAFNRVLAAAVAAAWTLAPTPSIGASITISDSSCSGFTANTDTSGNVTVTCTGAPPPASACSISVSPNPIGSNGGSVSITLTSGCGTTASVTGGKSLQSAGTLGWTDNIPANTGTGPVFINYSVAGTNATATLTQNAPGSTGGGTGNAAADCAAAGMTAQVIDMAWSNQRYFTKGFNGTNVAVFHFRTPSSVAPGSAVNIGGAENGGGPRTRHAVLSTRACDFAKQPSTLAIWGPYMYADGPSPHVSYAVGGSPTTSYNALLPNTDYYFNVKNDPSTCPGSTTCEMYFDMTKPLGL